MTSHVLLEFVEDSRVKGQMEQSQPLWRSHEAGYKTSGDKEASSFFPLLGLAVLAKTALLQAPDLDDSSSKSTT